MNKGDCLKCKSKLIQFFVTEIKSLTIETTQLTITVLDFTIATLLLVIVAISLLDFKSDSCDSKLQLFLTILSMLIIATLYLAVVTLYLRIASMSQNCDFIFCNVSFYLKKCFVKIKVKKKWQLSLPEIYRKKYSSNIFGFIDLT